MARPTLDDLTDRLDSVTVGGLGDPVTYQSASLDTPVDLSAFIDRFEAVRDFGQSASNASELQVSIRVSDLPVRPTKDALLTITRTGLTYRVVEIVRDASGRWWNMRAAKVS